MGTDVVASGHRPDGENPLSPSPRGGNPTPRPPTSRYAQETISGRPNLSFLGQGPRKNPWSFNQNLIVFSSKISTDCTSNQKVCKDGHAGETNSSLQPPPDTPTRNSLDLETVLRPLRPSDTPTCLWRTSGAQRPPIETPDPFDPSGPGAKGVEITPLSVPAGPKIRLDTSREATSRDGGRRATRHLTILDLNSGTSSSLLLLILRGPSTQQLSQTDAKPEMSLRFRTVASPELDQKDVGHDRHYFGTDDGKTRNVE